MQPMAGQANFMSAAGNVKYRRIMLSVAFGHLGVHSMPGTHAHVGAGRWSWRVGGDHMPAVACVRDHRWVGLSK